MTRSAPTRPNAIVAHSYWGRGGAEIAATYIIAALSRDFEVSVYTRGGFDAAVLARLADVPIESIDRPVIPFNRHGHRLPGRLAHAAFVRSLNQIGRGYDVRVTASGVLHWGLPAIHFISSGIWHPTLARRHGVAHVSNADSASRQLLTQFSNWIADNDSRALDEDIFIANSAWTAKQSSEFCSQPIEILYPAVAAAATTNWDQREDGVLVFGRISPEKRIEICIEIVEQLRRLGHPLKLCIVGPEGDAAYVDEIDQLCRARRTWARRLPMVQGTEKQRLLSRFRYGLSACEIEAFGIATAEMTARGMIVMVPALGGQSEIITHEGQSYTTVEEAAAKLASILTDRKLQSELHTAALTVGPRFAPHRFTERVQALAIEFARNAGRAGKNL